mmetsp:Transcript_59814/g.146999  ORF Transcript_59814/g.146999 Transcript_59814/m.146999 type:complete len:254 (+) Transcript_59814:2879-3640(+)
MMHEKLTSTSMRLPMGLPDASNCGRAARMSASDPSRPPRPNTRSSTLSTQSRSALVYSKKRAGCSDTSSTSSAAPRTATSARRSAPYTGSPEQRRSLTRIICATCSLRLAWRRCARCCLYSATELHAPRPDSTAVAVLGALPPVSSTMSFLEAAAERCVWTACAWPRASNSPSTKLKDLGSICSRGLCAHTRSKRPELEICVGKQSKGETMGRSSKRSGWLHTLRSCISTLMISRRFPDESLLCVLPAAMKSS